MSAHPESESASISERLESAAHGKRALGDAAVKPVEALLGLGIILPGTESTADSMRGSGHGGGHGAGH